MAKFRVERARLEVETQRAFKEYAQALAKAEKMPSIGGSGFNVS